MKKLTALVLSLVMLFTLVGCGSKEDKEETAPEGLYYELTGLDPAATILTVEGKEVPVEMFLYWVLYACDYVEANYGAKYLDADGRLKWDEMWNDEMPLSECVLEEATNTAKMYMIVEKWAEDYGVVLSEESEQAVDNEIAAIAEQLGGEEELAEYLDQLGITAETNRRMTKMFYLYANMLTLTKEEGSPLYIDDEVLYQYDGITEDTVLADHILVVYPETEEEKAETLANMQELRAQIVAQEDPVTAFTFIADNYSDDPGRQTNPNGYLVTEDAAFVQSFKDTALSLEEYEISEVVESEYGYHILMRRTLRDYVADLYLGDLITVAIENAEVEWAEEYESFDLAAFYAGYQDHVAELEAAAAESDETESDTAEGDETETGDGE